MRDPTQRQSKAVGEKSNALSSGRRYFISGINPESKLSAISKVCSVFGDVAYIEKVISSFIVCFSFDRSNLLFSRFA